VHSTSTHVMEEEPVWKHQMGCNALVCRSIKLAFVAELQMFFVQWAEWSNSHMHVFTVHITNVNQNRLRRVTWLVLHR